MDSFTHIYNWRVNVIEINEMSPWWNVVMSDSLTCLKSMCVSWWRDGAMEWNTCFNKVQNWDKNVNWKKIYKSFLVESPLIMLLLIKWRLSVLRAAPGAFPLRLEWTWVKTLNVYDFLGYVQPSSVHSSFKYSVYFLSVCLSQWKESNSPLCHIIFNFHQLHPQTVNTTQLLSAAVIALTPVAYGSCSPTDVSMPQSPPWCFLAEWRQSRRVSSGDWAQPGLGRPLWEWIAHQHQTGKTQQTFGHLFSTVVSCLRASYNGRQHGTVRKVNTPYNDQICHDWGQI